MTYTIILKQKSFNVTQKYSLLLFLVAVFCGAVMLPESRADIEILLAEINGKSAEERLRVLVEGAKKEGVLYYYGATNLMFRQESLRKISTKNLTTSLPSCSLIYNSAKVKPAKVPKSYEELLNPRWKGRLVMDREEYDWLAGLIDVMGESKAVSLFKRLVDEQKLNFKRNHSLITQLVAAGEHDLFIDGYVHNAGHFKSMKAPIDFVFTNPTIVRPPSMMAITSGHL